jgi:hypothetical protein
MNLIKLLVASSAVVSLVALQGCAAETASDAPSSDPNGTPSDSSESDIKSGGNVSAANAKLLMDALQKANAPSNTPAGLLGVGSRIGRIQLTTAQGGMAHFIGQGGELSTLDGADLGNVVTLGLDWTKLGKALVSGGAKWATQELDHGASSSSIFAKVECKQVVSPTAKPSCTVSPITLTASDSEALMQVLENVDAPSNTPAGLLGVGSRIARVTLTTAQGGTAHFISEGLTAATLAGKHLGDLGTAATPWADVRTALVDGTSIWQTTNGAHGSSSSKIVATIECKQVVAPGAKPACTVTPEPGL